MPKDPEEIETAATPPPFWPYRPSVDINSPDFQNNWSRLDRAALELSRRKLRTDPAKTHRQMLTENWEEIIYAAVLKVLRTQQDPKTYLFMMLPVPNEDHKAVVPESQDLRNL
jgi:hypothetical protein